MSGQRVILVTGFEPFGRHAVNPSEALAKAVDAREVSGSAVRGVTLPVHHTEASRTVARLLAEVDPAAVLHLGLAEGRARIGLERAALNVMDYPLPDGAGYTARDEPCVPGGPAAYFSTLPLRVILDALTAEGIPADVSDSPGTYLCNQTLYATLHLIHEQSRRTRAGFVHVPLLPAMVAASGLDAPSMDFAVMLRALEVALEVIATREP